MGVFSNKIDRAKLKPGDHIYSYRTAYLYSHHGIYMGDGTVIHFTRAAGQDGSVLDRVIGSSIPSHPTDSPCPVCGDQSSLGGVICSCIDCFLSGGDLYIFEYGVSPISYIANTRQGTCALVPSDPSEEVIHRATFLLENGFGAYSVFKKNCEDFAMYCKTSLVAVGRADMGLSGQVASLAASLAAAASIFAPLPLGASYARRTALGLGMYCLRRWVSNTGMERVSVETLVASSGFIIDPEQKDQIDFSNPGLLQPLPIPTQPWKDISMDFIEGLPTSHGFNSILVVVDRLSKYSHFLPLHHPYTAIQVAQVFFDNVFKSHGLPDRIVSDRDKKFMSTLWKELFKLAEVELVYSTAYHPETDGQTERVNQCLENYLRAMTHQIPKKWCSWLSLAEYWYNTTHHSSLKTSPFEALYGYKPPLFGLDPISSNVAAAEQFIQQWQHLAQILKENLLAQILKENLQKAQERMKLFADGNMTERSFNVGDWVYLRLQPYRQQSLSLRRNMKIAARYFGPFKVIEKVGKVAYKLRLPEESKIHPVFHVSLLERQLGHGNRLMPFLPETTEEGQLKLYPHLILQTRLVNKNGYPVAQYLVQWARSAEEDATWEDGPSFGRRFADWELKFKA